MSTSQSTVDYILDQTEAAGEISARKMFGEYALYCNGKVVGLVCDDTLFIKITPEGKKYSDTHYSEGHAYKGAKASMMIDADLIENSEWISELVSITEINLPISKKKIR